MNEQLEQIFEAPLKIKLAALAGVLVLVFVVYWSVFWSSMAEELAELERKTDEIKLEVSQKQSIAANLESFREKVRELDIELDKALHELPDQKQVAELLAKVSDKARDTGLDIRLFKPRPESKKDFYAEVPVELEVYGKYHQVGTFFDEVSKLERIVNLTQFSMKNPLPTEGGIHLTTGVVATSFRFLEEGERPDESEQQDKKRRKRRPKK